MTDKQKSYIEENIELIQNNEWEKFFKFAPEGVGALLYEAEIPFLEELGYVPNSAFCASNIQTIDIPNGLTSIGSDAFRGCRSLTRVTIPDSVTTIDAFAFYNCTKLTRVNIPDNITIIGDYAFYNCYNLTSINIPDSVINIGEFAFRDCGELDIYYNGTKATWRQVFNDRKAIFKNTTYTCTCTDGVVKKSR